MTDKDKSISLIPAHEGRYEDMLQQAVKLLDRLSTLVRHAEYEVSRAINGKNAVVRAVGVRDTESYLRKLIKETEHWHAVIETMKEGKDVHIEQNCKGSKLEIVSGEAYEFGQYIIDQSNGKFCKKNTEGKQYLERIANGSN